MQRLARIGVGTLFAAGLVLGLQGAASAGQAWITYANSVGAGNGGSTPGAAWDNWFQVYAEVKVDGQCAVLQYWDPDDGAWVWGAYDCSNDGQGAARLVNVDTDALIIQLCRSGVSTCSSSKLVVDDGT